MLFERNFYTLRVIEPAYFDYNERCGGGAAVEGERTIDNIADLKRWFNLNNRKWFVASESLSTMLTNKCANWWTDRPRGGYYGPSLSPPRLPHKDCLESQANERLGLLHSCIWIDLYDLMVYYF